MTIEQLLEQSRSLPKKEIVIGNGRTFAYYTPVEIFSNPELVLAVKSQDYTLVEAELIRLSREYHDLHPEMKFVHDYMGLDRPVRTREKSQDEIDETFISYPVKDLMVVEVQGKFTIEIDDLVEIAVDQVQVLEKVLKFPHE